jgi:hypothetical protein
VVMAQRVNQQLSGAETLAPLSGSNRGGQTRRCNKLQSYGAQLHPLSCAHRTVWHELPCGLEQPEPRSHVNATRHRLAVGPQQLLLA